jgi:hypothetical protein
MAVYKKDGSVYKLTGPNILMFTQDNWGAFTTHNLKNLSNFKIESNIPHVVLGSRKESKPPEQPKIIEEKPEIKLSEKNNQKKLVIPENSKFIQKTKNEYEDFEKTIIHCALAKMEEKKDSLYGDVAVKTKFVEKFTFESIVLSLNDFTFIFWTMLDKLTVGSVLYPQDDSKRWWEIKEIESVPGGYKVVCVFTRNTPSF